MIVDNLVYLHFKLTFNIIDTVILLSLSKCMMYKHVIIIVCK